MNFFDELFTKKKEPGKASQKKGRDTGTRRNANEKRTSRPVINVSRSQLKENRQTKVLSRSNPDFLGARGGKPPPRQAPEAFVDAPQETRWFSHAKPPKAVDSPPPLLRTVNHNNNEIEVEVEVADRPMSVTDLDNITFRRGQVAKSDQGQGQGQGEDLSRSSSVTNLNADVKNKGALSKVRKSASKDRLDKIVDKKPEKKALTRNNNKIDGEHSYSTENLQEIESLQRQLQEMANEKTNLALQLGEQKGQMHALENEIQNLKVVQEQLNQENGLLRNRLRDVSHSPLSDNEKQQLLLESHRHHSSSAPASIATNLLDDAGAGGDITACPTPDWDKHSSSNVSEVSVACLQDKINQMQETHYSTNEELQATLQELTELQRQLTELQQDNERLSEEKALMFDSLCRQTERLNDSRAEAESLKQLLYRDKDDAGQLESVVEREQKLVDLLKGAQDEREALLLKQEQLNNELQEARGSNLEQAAVNAQLAERVKTLESTLDAKHAEHKQLDQELALAKDQSSGRQIEINRLTDLLENARTKIIELEQDRALSDKSELDELLDNTRKEKDALESEVAHLKEQVARSRNEAEKLRDQISILQEECKVTRNNAKCTQSELEYKCEKLAADKNTLSEQLQQLQEAANELQVQAQCQLEDKRQLSSVLSETQRNLSEAERRNVELENELADVKRLRKEENEEWEKFQNDLLTSVRVANDFKTEAQQDLQKMIMENKNHRERVRQLEAQLDKIKGEPEAIASAEEMPTEDHAPNRDSSRAKSKSPKAFFKKPKFFRHTKGGYYVSGTNEGGAEMTEGGGELGAQPRMSPPPEFVLDDLTFTDRPEDGPNETEGAKSKKTFRLLSIPKGDGDKTRDSRKMGFIKKHLSAQEQKDLHTLNELHAAIDPNIPEEDLTAEQKFIIKLKQMHDSNFEQTKQKPVAKKSKDNLAISKPLLNSVILNPKLKQIADDPTVRVVEDDPPRESVHPPPESFDFNGERQLRSRFDDVYRSNIEFRYYDIEDSRRTVQSFKPPDDTLTKKSRSMNDLYRQSEEFVQVSNFGVQRNISKSSNSLTNYVSSVRPVTSFGDGSAPGPSPYSSDSSDIETVENKSQGLDVTLDELYAKIDPNMSESQLSKEQMFVRQMKESLDDMGRKHTLKKEQKRKGLVISGPTHQSVMQNPKLVSLIQDPKTIEVRIVPEQKENMFRKFLGRFKTKKAETSPSKAPPILTTEDDVIPPPGNLRNSQSVPSLISSPPKPLANADSLPSLATTAPSENVANADSVSSLFQTVIVNSDLNKIIETRNSATKTPSPTLKVKNFQEATPITVVEPSGVHEDPSKPRKVWVDSYDVVVVRQRTEDAPKVLERKSVRDKIELFSQLSTSSENEAKPAAPMKNSSAPKRLTNTQMQTDVNLLSKGIDVRRLPTGVPKKFADLPPPLEFRDDMGGEKNTPITTFSKRGALKDSLGGGKEEPPKEVEDITALWKKEMTEDALRREEEEDEGKPPKVVRDSPITALWKREITEHALRTEEDEEDVEVVPILARGGKNRELSRLLLSKIEFTFGGPQNQNETEEEELKQDVAPFIEEEEVEYAVPRNFRKDEEIPKIVGVEESLKKEESSTKPEEIGSGDGSREDLAASEASESDQERRKGQGDVLIKEERPGLAPFPEPIIRSGTDPNGNERSPFLFDGELKEALTSVNRVAEDAPMIGRKEESPQIAESKEEATGTTKLSGEANFLSFTFFPKEASEPVPPPIVGEEDRKPETDEANSFSVELKEEEGHPRKPEIVEEVEKLEETKEEGARSKIRDLDLEGERSSKKPPLEAEEDLGKSFPPSPEEECRTNLEDREEAPANENSPLKINSNPTGFEEVPSTANEDSGDEPQIKTKENLALFAPSGLGEISSSTTNEDLEAKTKEDRAKEPSRLRNDLKEASSPTANEDPGAETKELELLSSNEPSRLPADINKTFSSTTNEDPEVKTKDRADETIRLQTSLKEASSSTANEEPVLENTTDGKPKVNGPIEMKEDEVSESSPFLNVPPISTTNEKSAIQSPPDRPIELRLLPSAANESCPRETEPQPNETLEVEILPRRKLNEDRDEIDYIESIDSETVEEVIAYTLILTDGPVQVDCVRETPLDIDDLDPTFGSQLSARFPARPSTASSISSEDEAVLRRLSLRLDVEDLVVLRDAQKKYNGPRPRSDINEEDLRLIELARRKYEGVSSTSSSESDFEEDLRLIELARLALLDYDVTRRGPYLRPVPDSSEKTPKIIEITEQHEQNIVISEEDIEMALQDDDDVFLREENNLKRMLDDLKYNDDDDVVIRDKNNVDDGLYIRPTSDFTEADLEIIQMARRQEDTRPTSDLNEEDLKLIDIAKRRDSERRRSDAGSVGSPSKIYDVPVSQGRRLSLERHSLDTTDLYEPVYENFSKYFAESRKKEGAVVADIHKPPKPLPRHPRSSGPEKSDDFDSIGCLTHQIMDLTKNLSAGSSEDGANKIGGTIPKKPRPPANSSEEAVPSDPSSMEVLYDSGGEDSSPQSSSHTADNSYLNLFKSPEQVVFENLSESDKPKTSGTFTLHFFKPDNLSSDESSSSTNNKVSFLRKKFESEKSNSAQKQTTADAHVLKNVPKVPNLPKNVDEVGDTDAPPLATPTLGISPGSENTSLENLRRHSRKSFENARSFFETTSADRVSVGQARNSNREEPDKNE